MKQLKMPDDLERFDIKESPIDAETLDKMKAKTGSYESLFSKRAIKYKALPNKNLSEEQYRQLLLDEYTFLKRPVIIYNDQLWVGNSKQVVDEVTAYFNKL
jgi:arsenate reductase